MKRKIQFLTPILVCLFYFKVTAQWNLVSPLPVTNKINSVYFPTSSDGWFVGETGSIYRTTDGGQSFTRQNAGTLYSLRSVFFISPTEGWIVGEKGLVLYTSNAGNTWSIKNTGFTNRINGVYFNSSMNGWIVGDNGLILKTNDGGVSWTTQVANTSKTLSSVTFSSSLVGWISTYEKGNTILKTIDGGNTWSFESINYMEWSNEVGFSNQNIVWIAGQNVQLSTDGGITWSTKYIPIEDVTQAYFSSNLDGWAIGINYGLGGVMYHTIDGGNSWVQYGSYYGYLYDLFFVTGSNAWAVGESILKTIDSGNTWANMYQSKINNKKNVYFDKVLSKNSSAVYITAYDDLNNPNTNYYLFKSTDGGVVWSADSLGKNFGTNIKSSSNNDFWILGNYSLFHSSDATATWSKLDFSIPDFVAIDFCFKPSGSIVVVGGILNSVSGNFTQHLFLESFDMGITWSQTTISNVDYGLYYVFFESSTKGWIADAYSVRRTNDGGNTWSLPNYISNNGFSINSVNFSSATNGNLATGEGEIYHTADGGITWSIKYSAPISNPISLNPKSIYFISENEGWAVGRGSFDDGINGQNLSTFLKTTDGGKTWQENPEYYSFGNGLKSISFGSANNGWAIGDNNIVLNTTNGGGSVSIQEKWQPNTLQSEVYPNPVNDISFIKFKLEKNSTVQLDLLDLTGRQIEALVSDNKTAGEYIIQLNKNNLTSGLYFYRLQIGNEIETRKIIVK